MQAFEYRLFEKVVTSFVSQLFVHKKKKVIKLICVFSVRFLFSVYATWYRP